MAADETTGEVMSQMVCPHCQSERLGKARVPAGVVAVMPCPECSELVVRFRHKVIALNKNILFQGSKDDRKLHLAEVISEFMDEDIIQFELIDKPVENEEEASLEETSQEAEEDLPPISEEEQRRFVSIDLDQLDNIDYFRKHLE